MGKPKATVETWLSQRAACQRLGITPTQLLKLAARGQVKTQSLPGEPLRYSEADVVKLATEREG